MAVQFKSVISINVNEQNIIELTVFENDQSCCYFCDYNNYQIEKIYNLIKTLYPTAIILIIRNGFGLDIIERLNQTDLKHNIYGNIKDKKHQTIKGISLTYDKEKEYRAYYNMTLPYFNSSIKNYTNNLSYIIALYFNDIGISML